MQQFKFNPQIKIRMLLILLFGAIICSLILAYGFFAIQKEYRNSVKQCRESLRQIDDALVKLRHK